MCLETTVEAGFVDKSPLFGCMSRPGFLYLWMDVKIWRNYSPESVDVLFT